ncbi:hypothetical protein Sjap_014521 [Stephania japonica]|uniref:Uncharacterized protein n=1 Tax=Stephania japonica TaxID=461633 RepID=A0AAP0IHE1_9MAGN
MRFALIEADLRFMSGWRGFTVEGAGGGARECLEGFLLNGNLFLVVALGAARGASAWRRPVIGGDVGSG